MGQKWAKNGPKNVKNSKNYYHHFSGAKLPQIILLAIFTRCLVPEIQIFDHFWLKSAFLGTNSSRTEIFTAKPMVVSCVQHYSTHFVKKLGIPYWCLTSCQILEKSLERFLR